MKMPGKVSTRNLSSGETGMVGWLWPGLLESFRPMGDHVSKDVDSVLEDDT